MNSIPRCRLLFFLIIFLGACSSSPSYELEEFGSAMTGSFSSEAQADENENYRNIQLHTVRLQSIKEPGIWLYVEQFVAETPNQPYRQRVYHLEEVADGEFKSHIYTIRFPRRFTGGWKDIGKLTELTFDQITRVQGCSVTLEKTSDGDYIGGTSVDECKSDFGGAKYMTSEILVSENEMITWDRGFDDEGNLIWGPLEGGYRFKRI